MALRFLESSFYFLFVFQQNFLLGKVGFGLTKLKGKGRTPRILGAGGGAGGWGNLARWESSAVGMELVRGEPRPRVLSLGSGGDGRREGGIEC